MHRKLAAIIGVFQGRSDRYVVKGYTEQKSLEELLQEATKVKGLEGIELGARYIDFENPWEIIDLIRKNGFSIPLLIPDTFASTKYGRGSVIAPDPAIREEAIRHICLSMDLAEKIGCNMVSPWFGNDGYDYILQLDYLKSWDLMVEAVRICADHNPRVKIAIEYKIKEPRTHAFLNSMAKTLLLIDEVNRPNVGVNLDVGHALQGYENMAECACLLHGHGKKLFHIHVNDNFRYWDDDMIPGSVHTLEWVELFYWLDRIGYTGWLSLDVHAFRESDKIRVAQESVEWVRALEAAARRLDQKEVARILETQDAVASTAVLRKALLNL